MVDLADTWVCRMDGCVRLVGLPDESAMGKYVDGCVRVLAWRMGGIWMDMRVLANERAYTCKRVGGER